MLNVTVFSASQAYRISNSVVTIFKGRVRESDKKSKGDCDEDRERKKSMEMVK